MRLCRRAVAAPMRVSGRGHPNAGRRWNASSANGGRLSSALNLG
jgi:hypothetical protein